MKRHSCGLKEKKSESLLIEEEIAFDCSIAHRNRSPTSVNSLLVNCCSKCNCYRLPVTSNITTATTTTTSSSSNNNGNHFPIPALNASTIQFCKRSQRINHAELKMRLKEKSKKRLESKKQATEESAIVAEDLEASGSSQISINEPTAEPPMPFEFLIKSKSKQRSNSAISENDDVCTLKRDCRCKECLYKLKIAAELIAEEESSKKKKSKKKKKNRSALQQQDDSKEDKSNSDKDKKSEKKPSEPEVKKDKSIDNDASNSSPEIAEELQWIKVKNKFAKHNLIEDWDGSTATAEVHSGSECSARASESSNFNSEFDMESNGFKLINNDKRRNSNNVANRSSEDLCIHKEMDTLNINDTSAMNSPSSTVSRTAVPSVSLISSTQKAKILLIEANLCFERSEIKEAIKTVSMAIELDPKSSIYWISRSLFHESINNFEEALNDAETALQLDDSEEYYSHALYRKAKALSAFFQYEECEKTLNMIKQLNEQTNQYIMEKDLRLIRLKKLLYLDYDLELARLYAAKFNSINDALKAIQQNCKILSNNENDEIYILLHEELVKRQLLESNELSVEKKNDDFASLNKLPFVIQYDSDDEDIFVSDEEEYDLLFGNIGEYPKGSLIKRPNKNQEPKESNGSKGQKALWIGNVSPACSIVLATNIFAQYGNVTFCKIFPNEKTNELAYLLLHFDNDISPQVVMKQFKDKVIDGISKDHLPLLIRYRNKNDKDESTEYSSNQMQSCPSTPVNASNGGSAGATGSNSATKSVSECYYWRTTGCDRERCQYKHVPSNKGIDRQAWMRRKN